MSKLYLIPTPIGNLEDMTYRGVRMLEEADLILAEDTRTSGVLLKHYGIRTPMQSHHKFNEHQTTGAVVQKIKAGQTVALISDAGTPGISDPGFYLVRACIENDIEVECLPGPAALIPAIVMSGLPNDRFVFEGFLPHKKGRQTRFRQLAQEERTIVFYESPHRITKTVQQLSEHLGGDRQACICRELSKKFEEAIRGSLEELVTVLNGRKLKGEIVLVVAGKS